MKLKLISAFFILSFLSLLIYAIEKNSKPSIITPDPAFATYISGYTSGMISRDGTIKIELATEVASNSVQKENTSEPVLPDSSLLKNCFKFSPAIKGKAVFTSNRTIEFKPDKPLDEQTLYTATLKLSRLLNVKEKFKEFRFQFSTYKQNMFVDIEGLHDADPFHIEWQTLHGTVKLSDVADTAKLFTTIQASYKSKKILVRWNHEYQNEYSFYVDSIQRGNEKDEVEINWDGSSINAVQHGTSKISVPALGDFSVTKASVIDDENQYISLLFSDPIQSNQNLQGLLTIDNQTTLTFSIEGNEVKIFLPNRIEGWHTIIAHKGIKNFKGYAMNNPFQASLEFKAPNPKVVIRGKGNILPNSQGLFMPFESIGLKAVDIRIIKIFENNVTQFLQVNDLDGNDDLKRVGKIIAEQKVVLGDVNATNVNQWTKHVLDLKQWMSPDPGSIYRISIKFNKSYTNFDCPNSQSDETDERDDDEVEDWTSDEWHGYDFDHGYDTWESYNEDYSPCDQNYYDGKAVSRNIIASDLGLIYKMGEDKMAHVFVSNMLTTEPLPKTEIQVLDYTKQIIASGVTDNEGQVQLALNRKPFLIVAKKGNQKGYMKVTDGLSNSLSKFSIDGEKNEEGVKGYIYGERGVWRPGDSLFLTFILEDKLHRLPANHPVHFTLKNPSGVIQADKISTSSVDGMYDFRCATSYNAPTGNYEAEVSIGNRHYTKRIAIETVKPNRLKVSCEFPDSVLSAKTNDKFIHVQAKWLHGGVANQLKAEVYAVLQSSETKFKQFPKYIFQSPLRSAVSNEIPVFDGELNDQGKADIKSSLAISQNSPGMMKATYITKVFENGGDFSIDRSQVAVSPYNAYVGLSATEMSSEDQPLEVNKKYNFHYVVVDEKGNALKGNKVQLRVYKLKSQWWYESNDDDFSNFVTKNATSIVLDSMMESNGLSNVFSMNVKENEWGKYMITLSDMKGGHETGSIVYFDQPYWNRSNHINKENATMLSFSTNKESYVCGEKIKLTIPTSSKGKALISIENSIKILHSEWINTTVGETKYELTATANMTPNVYIHITYLQPHIHTVNDLPIRMYGVIPISVIDENTVLHPIIEAPLSVRPEEYATIKIKEAQGRKITYTLALVDNGLLDLTHFHTPEPWENFYAKQALGVKTWDMYNAVIGAYSGKLDKMISIGGDGEIEQGSGNKANRFKPVVKFVGPFTLEKGKAATHKILLPNYIGSVRVMVVAQHDGSYGTEEKDIIVKKPLMILSSLSRVLSPNEEIEMPVNVFAMEKSVKDVNVSITSNDMVLFEQTQKAIHFSTEGDEILPFHLKVKNKVGIARIKIKAICGKETASEEIEVEVRVPNPIISTVKQIALEPGQTTTQNILFAGIEGSNAASVEISSIPYLGIDKRMDYLIQYPHGCIEQTTSSVFPQLYVSRISDMNDSLEREIAFRVKAAITRIQRFQTFEGGFSYWPGENESSEFGSNYAGHFLLEAEKSGYVIPSLMKANWLKYQKQKAQKWSETSPSFTEPHDMESHQCLQAYRLFTLALNRTPEIGAMNQLREDCDLKPMAKWRLAAAYQLIGQTEVAAKLCNSLPLKVTTYKELSYGYGSDFRDMSITLETLSLLHDKPRGEKVSVEIIAQLNDNTRWMSTQETAYALLSVCKFYQLGEKSQALKINYCINTDKAKDIVTDKKISKIMMREKGHVSSNSIRLKNNGASKVYVNIITKGAPLLGDTTRAMNGMTMSVVYKNMKGEIMNPSRIIQGTDFKAIVTITNTNAKRNYKEMALTQLFAGGWEIHNARMDETNTTSAARYEDIRDDRIYSYYDLPVLSSKTFTVQLNASYLGKYYLPSISSEAMYDHSISAHLPGRWVEVVKDVQAVTKK